MARQRLRELRALRERSGGGLPLGRIAIGGGGAIVVLIVILLLLSRGGDGDEEPAATPTATATPTDEGPPSAVMCEPEEDDCAAASAADAGGEGGDAGAGGPPLTAREIDGKQLFFQHARAGALRSTRARRSCPAAATGVEPTSRNAAAP